MNSDLALRIELFLLDKGDWVPVKELCRECSVPERLLRAAGRRKSIFSKFAISCSTKGIKHIALTTPRERIQYKHSRLKVLIANRRALDEFTLAVTNCLTGRPTYERLTGQMTFFK
jgi:hypothetical protein